MLIQGEHLRFNGATKTWQYNAGNYSAGDEAVSLVNTKNAMEFRGMKMIPGFECMSHIQWYISKDSSISEFPDSASWKNYYNADSTYLQRHGQDLSIQYVVNHVAFVGNYPAVKNPGMDAIVNEQLSIIKANWGATALGGSFPEFVLIGHDEIGCPGTGCVKNPNSRSGKQFGSISASTLLAREIAFRYKQVQDAFADNRGSTQVKVMVYGDCFSNESNGEFTGFSATLPDLKTDKDVLSMAPGISKNLYILPWVYSYVDNSVQWYWRNSLKYDKRPVLQNFTKLKFKYIPCAGEDGPVDFNDKNWVANEAQCTFEWVRAAQLWPDCFSGYGILHFNAFGKSGTCATSGFTDPILAYLEKYPYIAKSYPSDPLFPVHGTNVPVCPYNAGVLAGVNYHKARNDVSWVEGVHYVVGLGLRQIGSARIGAVAWNQPDFTRYTLSSDSTGSVASSSDNFVYAFAERNDTCDVRVRIGSISAGAVGGIMIRQDLQASSRNIHLYYDNSSSDAKISHRDAAKALTKTDAATMAGARHLRMLRTGRFVTCFAGTDGNAWTKLGRYPFRTGAVLVGFTNAAGNRGSNSSTIIFDNLSIK